MKKTLSPGLLIEKYTFSGIPKYGRCSCNITAKIKKEKNFYNRSTICRKRFGDPYRRKEGFAKRLGAVVKGVK